MNRDLPTLIEMFKSQKLRYSPGLLGDIDCSGLECDACALNHIDLCTNNLATANKKLIKELKLIIPEYFI